MKFEQGDVVYCEPLDLIAISLGCSDYDETVITYNTFIENEIFTLNEIAKFKYSYPNGDYVVLFTINNTALTLISKGDFK